MWIEKATHTQRRNHMFEAIKNNPGATFLVSFALAASYGLVKLAALVQTMQGA